ncbi:MAG: glycosyltransferase family 39 protein [Thermoflavifilum aggregans]|nr:glycosyltransferase family 39 protein [Thermoflavifilum aggregans]
MARKLLDGAIPYKEIFDMNMPGTYWIHMATLQLFGESNLGFRIVDLLFLCITLFAGGKILKPFGITSILLFVISFAGIHLSGGEVAMGERDFFMIACISVSIWLFLNAQKKFYFLNLFLSGIFLGYATGIKPTGILFFILLCGALFLSQKDDHKKMLKGTLFITIGYLFFPALFVLWIVDKGGLSSFLDMLIHYLPIFNKGAKNSIFTLISTIWRTPVGILLVFFILSIPFLKELIHDNSKKRIINLLILFGILFSLMHYLVQGTNFYYHLYPLYFFSSVFLSIIIYYLLGSDDKRIKLFGFLMIISWMCILDLFTIPTIVKKANPINQYDRQVAEQPAMIQEIVDKLKKDSIHKHEKVQVFDELGGGPNVLLELHADIPTRFLQEVHFTEMEWKGVFPPYLQSLWDEFIFGLYAHKPQYIVMFKSSYFYLNKASNEGEKIELNHFIKEYYRPIAETEKYIIYKVKDF